MRSIYFPCFSISKQIPIVRALAILTPYRCRVLCKWSNLTRKILRSLSSSFPIRQFSQRATCCVATHTVPDIYGFLLYVFIFESVGFHMHNWCLFVQNGLKTFILLHKCETVNRFLLSYRVCAVAGIFFYSFSLLLGLCAPIAALSMPISKQSFSIFTFETHFRHIPVFAHWCVYALRRFFAWFAFNHIEIRFP